jgi:glutamate carboxypeptidase
MDNMKDSEQVLAACQQVEVSFIKDWQALVAIDSPTCCQDGLAQMGDFIVNKLIGLGATVVTYPVNDGQDGYNVVGTIEGNGGGSILLLVHMDTVFPVGAAVERPFHIDDEGIAHGPGVSDDKAGIVQCLHALEILRNLGYTAYKKITLLANCQEENGSHETRELIMKLAREHDCVLCAEAGLPGDGICTKRVGSGNLVTEVKGRTAHAAYPWQGYNAADELAYQVLHLNQLANQEAGTIITTRILEAGMDNVEKNVVPDQARAVMRVYAHSPEEMDRVEQAAWALAQKTQISGTQVTSSFQLAFPPFVQSAKNLKLAGLAQQVYQEIGLTLTLASGAAATDAGWAAAVNEATLCSVGPVSNGQNHTVQEGADVKSIVPRLYLLTRLLMELGLQECI